MILAPFLNNHLSKTEKEGESAQSEEVHVMPSVVNISSGDITKYEVKIVTQPLGVKVVSPFSVEKHLESEKEEEVLQVPFVKEELPNDHFSDMDLQMGWAGFLKDLSHTSIVTWNAINAFKLVKVGENQIEVGYSSDSAKKEFEMVEGDFLNYFRRRVNNFRTEIVYKADTIPKKELLTKRKLFDQFVEINPVLKDLEELMKFDFS